MKNIFISTLNFNGRKNTLECLDSIKKLTQNNFKLQVILIDNGSKEDIGINGTYLGEIPLKIIKNKDNLGFSAGHNVGIKYALSKNADYVLILNNDTIVDKNLIDELFSVCEKDKIIGIACPKIYFASGFEFHKKRYKTEDLGKIIWYAGGKMDWKNIIGVHVGVDEVDRGQYDKVLETEFASGCCMFIKKEVLERVGPFDEKHFLYYEDSDLSQRAKKVGYKIAYVPDAFLWHKNAASAGGSGSSLQDYYITRNRLLFAVKYAPLKSKLALLRESLSLMLNGRKWQKRGVLDFYLGKFGKGSYLI
jgi:hypothetical protein